MVVIHAFAFAFPQRTSSRARYQLSLFSPCMLTCVCGMGVCGYVRVLACARASALDCMTTSLSLFRYEGYWHFGKPHKHGSWSSPTGENYKGQFAHGDRVGLACWKQASGIKYCGQYANNKKNGLGVWTHPNGNRYEPAHYLPANTNCQTPVAKRLCTCIYTNLRIACCCSAYDY